MTRVWATRYLGYLGALLAAAVSFCLMAGALYVALWAYGGFEPKNLSNWDSYLASRFGLSLLTAYLVGAGAMSGIAIVPAALAFRWIGSVGWTCRPTVTHTVIGALLTLSCILVVGSLSMLASLSTQQVLGAYFCAFFVAGFGWHVFAQSRTEARMVANAREEEINAFA